MNYTRLLLLSILFIPQLLSAQSLVQKIETAYKRFESDSQLRYGISSLTVLDGRTGEVVFSKNGDIGLAPASTLKTVTAATALHLLGKDFRWETKLGYNGTIINGVLNGDLILIGGADPSLGSSRYPESKAEVLLQRWTNVLRQAGIKKIDGRVIADDRLLGTQTLPGGWNWQDMGNYYGAGPSSLSWRENQFDLI